MLEIEIKILEIDPLEIERKLLNLGAKKEVTVLVVDKSFDFSNHFLNKRKQLLRLRVLGDKFYLAHKGNMQKSEIARIVEETETQIYDAKIMESILKKIGLQIVKHREKKRTSFILGNARCEIDQYPQIPPYMEIEGSEKDILDIIGKLGYSLKDTTKMSASKVLKKYKIDDKFLRF